MLLIAEAYPNDTYDLMHKSVSEHYAAIFAAQHPEINLFFVVLSTDIDAV